MSPIAALRPSAFEEVKLRGRRELKQTSGGFLDGLLSGIARKTGWMMAEQAGAEKPYRIQSLLGRSRWEANTLRDRVRDYVIAALGDADGVLVVDGPGSSRRARIRSAWRGNISAPQGGSRTARSACFWAAPVALATG